MLACDAGLGATNPSSNLVPSPAEASDLKALAKSALTARFCSWRGRSGKRYVFSVYEPARCPAFCDAVLLAVTREPSGRRRVVAALDTGAFPEPVLGAAKGAHGAHVRALEFHLHLLAADRSEREAVRADLAPDQCPMQEPPYSQASSLNLALSHSSSTSRTPIATRWS